MKHDKTILHFANILKYSKKLPIENAIYVVDTDKDGKKISSKKFKERIMQVEDKFIKMFGGYVNEDISHGKFVSKITGKIIREKVARIRSFTDLEVFNKYKGNIEMWILKIKKDWNQEAIAYEFGKDLYYI